MKLLSLHTRNVLPHAACLFAMLFVLHGPAAAQWNPPGDDDPCDNPLINCGILDMGSWVDAAEAVDQANQDRAEGDPLSAFIYWLAEITGPTIPGAPEEDPPEDPSPPKGPKNGGNGEEESQGSRSECSAYYVEHPEANSNMFNWLDGLEDDEVVHTIKVQGRQAQFRLVYRRKLDRQDASQYEAVFLVTQKRAEKQTRGNVLVRGAARQVYLYGCYPVD